MDHSEKRPELGSRAFISKFKESHYWEESPRTDEVDFGQLLRCTERYEQPQLIGEGALKAVYRCYDKQLNRPVALARTKEGLSYDADCKLIHEAWVTAGLNHPGIIKIHSIDLDEEERPFFTMDLMGHASLTNYLEEPHHSLDEKLRTFLKICDALSYAHQQGVIHLDLKPDNIQCGKNGEVIVCDWGLAQREVESDEEVELYGHLEVVRPIITSGEIQGSPGYLAPEQVSRDGEPDHRTDIYALGCILYALMTGRPPQMGAIEEVLLATREGRVPSPRQIAPKAHIPRPVEAIMMKALHVNPEERYQSVADLNKDILAYLSFQATSLQQQNPISQLALFFKRHQRETILTVIGLFCITIVGIVLGNQVSKFQSKSEDLNKEVLTLEGEYKHISSSFNVVYRDEAVFAQSPVSSTEKRISNLLRMAQYDPENDRIKDSLLGEYIITMNFQAALQYLHNRDNSAWKNLSYKLISPYAHFDYNREKRPSVAEICDVVSNAPTSIHSGLSKYVSEIVLRLILYDLTLRNDPEAHNEIISAYLNNVNARTRGYRLHYTPENETLHISADEQLTLGHLKTLSYLRVKELKLSLPAIHLEQFQNIHCEVLDLSECREIHIPRGQISTINLDTVISPSMAYKRRLEDALQCNRILYHAPQE